MKRARRQSRWTVEPEPIKSADGEFIAWNVRRGEYAIAYCPGPTAARRVAQALNRADEPWLADTTRKLRKAARA